MLAASLPVGLREFPSGGATSMLSISPLPARSVARTLSLNCRSGAEISATNSPSPALRMVCQSPLSIRAITSAIGFLPQTEALTSQRWPAVSEVASGSMTSLRSAGNVITAPVWHQIVSWRLGYGRGKERRLLDEVDLDDAERRMKTSRSAFS
jgi:hypothetical protein